MSEQVQFLVPIYNEGENVRILYDNLVSESFDFDSLKFVYDADEDTSLPYIAEISQNDPRVLAEKNQIGRGVINALSWGFSRALEGPVIVLMGDNSDKLSILPEMYELWKDGATIVNPSRYMKGGVQHGGGVIKSFLSKTAGRSLKLIGFPTADPTNNFKLYDGEWLRSQKIESRGGFEVALELTYKAYLQGQRIVELPTEWFDREMGESQFQFRKWLPLYLRWYLKAVCSVLKSRIF